MSASDFTFQLAFDWDFLSQGTALGVVYPLQASLVDNRAGNVISPANLSAIVTEESLDFSVFDITSVPSGASPQCLQVLFSSAVGGTASFTPLENPSRQLIPELTMTGFAAASAQSVAYGKTAAGWTVGASAQSFAVAGRFELRMLLTVTQPNEIARYYFVDPEMVVGSGGTG